MQQYYKDIPLEKYLELNGDLFHYLKNVIKIRVDEQFYLFNGFQKAVYKVDLIDMNNKVINVSQVSGIEIEKAKYKVDLAVGLLKKDNIELIIQKTTELGINNIYLLNLQNNVVKFADSKVDKKLLRYNDIALSACCQSKRNSLSEVKYIANKELIKYEDYDYVYFLYENEDELSFSKHIYEIEHIENKKILLICGPEGGYSKEEVKFFKNFGISVTLNNNILRAETAAIIAVGLIKGIKG